MRNYVLKKSAGDAVCVVCESSVVKRDISRFLGIGADRIRVIQSPPMDTICSFHPKAEDGEALRRRWGLPNEFLFYPSRFWYHKNHVRLIECVRLLRDRHQLRIGLVLVGSEERNFRPTMRKVKELGCEDQVKWLGYVAESDLPYFYKLATALIVPSLFESVSMPIWEAFYLGCPVVSSDVCALPEQVGDAGLLFDPEDVEDMAEKILQVWNDRRTRRELVAKGHERVRGFTLESYATEWERMVRETSGV
jgi:glycosyltransferase involved in cell wall biosynthesis